MGTFQRLLKVVVVFLGLVFGANTAAATGLSLVIDQTGPGLSVAQGGIGLEALGAGSANITVNIGGPVTNAVLYWAGRDLPCTENPPGSHSCVVPFTPYKDQVLRFAGTLVTGAFVGLENEPSNQILNIGYGLDVTSIVAAAGTGLKTFTIEDGDTSSNLFRLTGAGLIVLYTDPAESNSFRVLVAHGLDYAFLSSPTAENQVTTSLTFNYLGDPLARQAFLHVFVGVRPGSTV